MAQAAFEVVGIVSWGDLDRAGAELRIDQHRIRDDLEFIPGDGVLDRFADLRLVPRIIRVHRHRRVAEHGLRPRGRDHDLAAAIGQRIGELVELALHALVVVDLEIRERRPARHAPVDEAARAVDEAFFVKADERLDHRRRVRRIHREDRALPVERAAEQLELAQNAVAGAAAPIPDALHERLAPDIVARLSFLLAQLALDHHLRRDAGVVHAGQPHGVIGRHALPAGEDVFNRVAERVTHVQRAGYVGRRDDDRERRLGRRRVGMKVPARHPFGVPARLDRLRFVGLGQLGHDEGRSFSTNVGSLRRRPSTECTVLGGEKLEGNRPRLDAYCPPALRGVARRRWRVPTLR